MLHQMEWDTADEGLGALMDVPPSSSECPQPKPGASHISEHEFSCHCCYDILVNPTTLTCGHNFCRHCLALWWESSHKNECPECREKWEGFPKINILLRYASRSRAISVVECLIVWQLCSFFSRLQRPTDNLQGQIDLHMAGAGYLLKRCDTGAIYLFCNTCVLWNVELLWGNHA